MKMNIPEFKPQTLIKTLFIGFLFSGGLFALIVALLSLFNIIPINFNNRDYVGVTGFVIGILFIPMIAIVCTFSIAPFVLFGTWLAKVIFNRKK